MFATFGKLASSIKILRINSLQQTISDKNHIIFEGEVEVIVDRTMRLWADRVEIDKEQQTLCAERKKSGAVSLENNDFIMLADKLFLNFDKKTGYADEVRIHISEGYVSARKAEKLDDNDWRMEEMMFTPCDSEDAHWHFKARTAMLHGNYFIKASGLLFKIGPVPVFGLPSMILPIQERTKSGQGRAKSGFLIPRFYYDYDYGFGLRQDYYRLLNAHCDTTFGVDWHDRKGIVFSNEFRWARSPESFTLTNLQYAVSRNQLVQKRGKIVKSTVQRYWVQGKDFQSIGSFGPMNLFSLIRMDFGTDKRIGYNFLNSINEVDDIFSNSAVLRGFMPHDILEIRFDGDQTCRKQFIDMTGHEKQRFLPLAQEIIAQTKESCKSRPEKNVFQKKEIVDKVTVIQLPHIEWNTSYRGLGNFLKYRHDFFVDQIFYRQQEFENIFFNSMLINQQDLIPLRKADLLRLGYRADLYQSFNIKGHSIMLQVNPSLQFRSNIIQDIQAKKNVFEQRIFGHGSYRVACEYGAEWALPELDFHTDDFSRSHYIQPSIKYDFVPKFFQKNWHYMDKWDRLYPKHQIALQLRNNNVINDYQVDVQLQQGYDFYNKEDIFPLRRGLASKHLLPFRYDVSLLTDRYHVACAQEFDAKNVRLLQSEISAGLTHKRFHTSLGYLFQNTEMQRQRELLSNIPHFVLFNVALPMGKHTTLHYDGQFYSEHKHTFFSLGSIKPLLHRVRLDYDGHCWGFYVGFEEKKYREFGTEKTEHYFVFSFRLETIGSFAKKIKQPQFARRT